LNEDHRLISLDVVSLFTNVPTNLIGNSIVKRWDHISRITKIPIEEFMLAVSLIIDSTYFTFNNQYYKQIFGTPMGSPLSPILADMVLQDIEDTALNLLPVSLPFYVRYVDDILLAAPLDSLDTILNTFNSFHDRLKFTMEIGKDNSINFLDTMIINKNGRIIFDLYKKPVP